MREIFILLALLCVSGCYDMAHAFPSTDVHVTAGKVSEVVLPEKVAKVIKGGAADSVLVEVLDDSVYIMPKSNAPADVFVTGVSGESYPLNLLISPQHDVRVQIKGPSVQKSSREARVEVMDVMKEMLLGHEPAGATLLKTVKTLAFDSQQIKLSVDQAYDLPHIAVYVLKAQNLIDNSVIIPLQQISFPHLLAAASDEDMLQPKGREGDTTKVYIIASK